MKNAIINRIIKKLEADIDVRPVKAIQYASIMLSYTLQSADRTIPVRLASLLRRGIDKEPTLALEKISGIFMKIKPDSINIDDTGHIFNDYTSDVRNIFMRTFKDVLPHHAAQVLKILGARLEETAEPREVAEICDLFSESFLCDPSVTLRAIPNAIGRLAEHGSDFLEEMVGPLKQLTDLFAKGLETDAAITALENARSVIAGKRYLPPFLRRDIQDVIAQGLKSEEEWIFSTAAWEASLVLLEEYDLSNGTARLGGKEKDTSKNLRTAYIEAALNGKISPQSAAVEKFCGGLKQIKDDFGWIANGENLSSISLPLEKKHFEGPPELNIEP